MADELLKVYQTWRNERGHLGWWPGETPFEIAVGALLTQNTAWSNVERAIANIVDANALNPLAIDRMGHEELAQIIRPSGYFNVKARRLKALVRWLCENVGGDPAELGRIELSAARKGLLSVSGVGRETADSILLYAAGHRIFVIDAYTRRIFGRTGMVDDQGDYDDLRIWFEDRLPQDLDLYRDFHAQIVIHGKTTCRSQPLCNLCSLATACAHANREFQR